MGLFWRQTWAQLLRWLWHLRREPFHITFTLVQPVIWLFLFSNAMKNVARPQLVAGDGPQPDYTSFLTAGILAFTVFGNAMSAGIPLLFDRENGFLGRLLSTPAARSSIILARLLYVTLISSAQALVILALATLMGVRVASGLGGVGMILLLSVLTSAGITVISLSLAFVLHHHGEFFAIMGFLSLPLMFVSSALAPLHLMPPWLAFLAQLNPMTYAVNGYRSLVIQGWEPAVLLRMAVILIAVDTLFAVVGVRVFRSKLA